MDLAIDVTTCSCTDRRLAFHECGQDSRESSLFLCCYVGHVHRIDVWHGSRVRPPFALVLLHMQITL